MKDLEIDVYADVVCPWCFIGSRRLHSVLESLSGNPTVAVRHHPYILHPDAPPEGIDLQAMLRSRYGTDPVRIFERVETAARVSGIPLDLSKQRRVYSTAAAHTLLRHAQAKGTQRALLDALFAAYFLQARNIADSAVLRDVATRHGFSAEEVEWLTGDETELARTRAEVTDTANQGIRGVPLLVFNRDHVLAGAQSAEVLRETIARLRDAS